MTALARKIRILLLIPALCAALLLGSLTAFAGSNGQELQVHQVYSQANYAWIVGPNQNNHLVQQWFVTTLTYEDDYGYWWKGSLTLSGYHYYDSGFYGSHGCTVPVSWYGTWYPCST